ncbi:hypothetical protein [Kribbella sp.]|uniref:hypothetical protein n=1 Tax=Kribbella sp. TaxID=1871183 RepID=UPI002D69B5FE|nr:hypothetical protein [Kribbella sp.]HZX06724.1 hypothetical protein [Kribbella sp.]
MFAGQQLERSLAQKLSLTTKPAHALMLIAMIAPTAKACAADVPAGSHSIHSCSPNYTDENKLGRLSVQQKGPGSSIQWGAYPKLPADRYVVSIHVDAKKVDGKRQSYPPHGSLPARTWDRSKNRYVATYKSGQIFRITGTSYNAKGAVVQEFYIRCKLV